MKQVRYMSLNCALGDCFRVRACSADKTCELLASNVVTAMKYERSESSPS